MRTEFGFVLAGEDPRRLRAAAEEARAEVEAAERELSAFSLGSLLNKVNREAGAGPVRVPAPLFELLALCRRVHEESGGAFDPSVAPLLGAWGFRGAAGSAAAAAAARPAVGLDGLALDPAAGTVRFRRPGMQLDLGGIGKGDALDRAAAALVEAGVGAFLLHGGHSTFLARGAPPGQRGWRVGVRDPADPGRLLAGVELRDRALSVSDRRGRTAVVAGEERGHIIDPVRGAPAAGELAVVAAPSAAEADAWSTALLAGASPHPVSWLALPAAPPVPSP
ncbi:MAG: FAD:protein FMN transferase [Planctomycetota bacterium]|nr:MAG: FAD:protein FMN transferase [Planctomycetota bacterium]